tara:strand:+ start:3815 stop:4039 length:225 start_codon:yes stop_codon:yes gene_type:complete
MGDQKATPISINGKDYILEELTAEQQAIIQHVGVAEQRIAQAKFDADSAQVTRDAFMNMLTLQLETDKAVDEIN